LIKTNPPKKKKTQNLVTKKPNKINRNSLKKKNTKIWNEFSWIQQ